MFILLLWKFYIFIFQVKGDNYRRKENGEFVFEVGCDLFSNTGKLNIYKPIEKWWFIEQIDFLKRIADPIMERVSANRIKYIFTMADP